MSDPDSDAVISVADLRVDAFQTVVTAGAAAEFGLDLIGFQVHIVMNNDNVLGKDFIKNAAFTTECPDKFI